MEKQQLDRIIQKVESSDWWTGHEAILAVHNAQITMGSFKEPFEENLKGLTLSQWQLEKAKRATLAVLNELRKEMED